MDAARVVVLGLNAWAVLVLVPLLLAGTRSGWGLALVAGVLLPLAAGVAVLRDRRAAAPWLLLGVFPGAVASMVAALPSLALQRPHSPFALALGIASLLAYGAFASALCSRPAAMRTATARPIEGAGSARAGRRRMRRHVLVATTAVGAMLVAVAAPLWGDRGAAEQEWGEAADEGLLLTAVAASVLGTAIVALFVAPAMRRSRARRPTERQSYVRATMLLMVVVAGLFTWWIVTQGGRPSEAF